MWDVADVLAVMALVTGGVFLLARLVGREEARDRSTETNDSSYSLDASD